MTAHTLRRVALRYSAEDQAATKQLSAALEAKALFDWIASQHPISIDLADGRCIDIANNPGGFWAALEQARASAGG